MAGGDHDHRAARREKHAAVAGLDVDRGLADEARIRGDERAELGFVLRRTDHQTKCGLESGFVCRLLIAAAARLLGPGLGFELAEANLVLHDPVVEELFGPVEGVKDRRGVIVPGGVGSVLRIAPGVQGGVEVRVVLSDDRVACRGVEGEGGGRNGGGGGGHWGLRFCRCCPR